MINSCNVYISGFFKKISLNVMKNQTIPTVGIPTERACFFNGLSNNTERKETLHSCPNTIPDGNVSEQKI